MGVGAGACEVGKGQAQGHGETLMSVLVPGPAFPEPVLPL